MPSGSCRPSLTMVFKSEPSGFDVRMRPAERSKKYKRATVFAASSAVSDLEALEDDIESFIPFSVAFIYERRFGRSALIWLDESAEAGNRLAELQPLLAVLERIFVSAHGTSCCLPADHESRHFQDARRISERLIVLQAVFFRNAAVLHRDQAVLHDLEGDLVLNFVDLETGCGLVLDDKRLDLVVGEIARPDDRDVAPGRIADPFLLAVEDPCVPITLGRSCKTARGS